MVLHPDFPDSPHKIFDPYIRWFPADEALGEASYEKLLPALVHQLRRKVKDWRDRRQKASGRGVDMLDWNSLTIQCKRNRYV